MGRWDVGTMGHKTLKNNVMDVMTGCFECFCSINKKSILCLFLLTC